MSNITITKAGQASLIVDSSELAKGVISTRRKKRKRIRVKREPEEITKLPKALE